MKPLSTVCKLCGVHAQVVFSGHPGYRQGIAFDIVHCPSCGTAFVLPLETDAELYEIIYSKVNEIPGYQRYAQYAADVLVEKDPLDYLGNSEEMYWAVSRYLQQENTSPNAKILEIGCGRGYLTYSMVKKGFDATGLDISSTAIENAVRQYGNNYVCADIYDYSRINAACYDVIIMTEVIEHVPDPKGFIQAALSLLKAGGDLVLTTPNRSAYHESYLWDTELPPVHLWWFSEGSLQYLAKDLNCIVRFTDYSECNSSNAQKVESKVVVSVPLRGSVLDKANQVCSAEVVKAQLRKYRLPWWRRKLLRFANKRARSTGDICLGGKRCATVCAVFKKMQ